MKKLILSLVAIATISLSSFGQAPEGFKYQAVVRDAGNTILNNQAVGMQIEILQGGISGIPVYTESFAPTTNTYGLVNLEIGTGTSSDDFTIIDWANDTYFIRTSIDVTGGSSYAVMGTSQLMSVPYALHAKTAENVTNDAVDDADADATNELQNIEQVLVVGSDANGNNILNIGQIGIGTSSPNTSAGIDMNTTTGALLLPRLTISQRDLLTPAEGMMIYNLDELKFQGYTYAYGEDYGSPVIDQVQSLFNNASISLDKSQSFQAGISGILNNVKVRLNTAGPGGTVTIKIRAGIGNWGAILYQEDVYVSYVSGGFLYSINPTNVIVSAGQSYTINITNVFINPFDSDFDWFLDTNNPYPQGDFYYDGMNITNFDAVFETSVMPLLPSTLQWVNLH
jgi:hypothetical protein